MENRLMELMGEVLRLEDELSKAKEKLKQEWIADQGKQNL